MERTARLLAAILLAAALVGCLEAAAETQSGGETDGPSRSTIGAEVPVERSSPSDAASELGWFSSPVRVSEDENEPSLVIAPDGTMYVSAIRGTPSESHVWVSTDHGEHWVPRNPHPTQGTALGFGLGGGDSSLAVDGNGRVGMSDLYVAGASFWMSADRGETWTGAPSHGVPVEDRNWIGASQTDFFHIGRLFTGGKTFCSRLVDTPAQGLAWVPGGVVWDDPMGIQNGNLAVDRRDGTLYVPYTVEGGIDVAVSRDCEAWTSHRAARFQGSGFYIFTPAAVDAVGTVYVAWVDDSAGPTRAFYAASRDQGATWSQPVALSLPEYRTYVFPWIVAGDAGRVAVSFLASSDSAGQPERVRGKATWDLLTAFVSEADSEPTVTHAVALRGVHTGTISVSGLGGSGDRSLGDFFQAAIDPTTGRIVIALATGAGDDIEVTAVVQAEGMRMTG